MVDRGWQSFVSHASGGLVWVMALSWLLVLSTPTMAARPDCNETSTGLLPLTDLGAGTYLGEEGGLYPGGSNAVPEAHLELGMELSRLVAPLNEQGDPDASGWIGLISIGVSNTLVEFDRFIEVTADDSSINPRLILVNGAQGARPLDQWAAGPEANPWFNLSVDVSHAGMTPEQVQVAWVKLPERARGTVSLDDAGEEVDRLTEVVRIAKALYPNLRLVYLSSRIYGGYSFGSDSEPKAYQHGFAVKWLIERQIEGDQRLTADQEEGSVVAPWLAWGPYLWADGMVPRSDGLVWRCEDFADDGIHPGPGAADKVADLLLQHFSTHPTSTGWFLAGQSTHQHGGTSAPPALTSTPDRRDHRPDESVPPIERRGELAQPARPSEPYGGFAGISDEMAWFVAGAATGLGISLTAVLVVHAFRQSASPRGPSDEL